MTDEPLCLAELPAGECHVHVTVAPETLAPDRVRAYRALVTSEEDERRRAFRFERHQHLFLLTRALVRTTLSRYAPVHPSAWRFAVNAWGKPFIAAPLPRPPLSFNLSNTDGMVVCAITRGIDVGVDVENIERAGETVSIAKHFFSAREVADLRALPEELQRARFFAYWTLKESYIKARGMGLAVPLDQFSFLLGSSRADVGIAIELDPRLGDDPGPWQFARLERGPPHAMALALRRGTEAPDLTVRVLHSVPDA